jgi:hypothetical protein
LSRNRAIQWLFLAATTGLLMLLKQIHLGVTHYNVFLIILIGWNLGLVIAFRALTVGRRAEN